MTRDKRLSFRLEVESEADGFNRRRFTLYWHDHRPRSQCFYADAELHVRGILERGHTIAPHTGSPDELAVIRAAAEQVGVTPF